MLKLKEKNSTVSDVSSYSLSEKEFEELFKEYEMELRYLAYKYVRDWILVDDIMQEVFIKIFLKLDSFEKKSSIRSWLYTITYNQCIDHFRSKTVKSTVLIENVAEVKEANTDSAEVEAIQQFEKNWLYHTVNSLPNQFREPIFSFLF